MSGAASRGFVRKGKRLGASGFCATVFGNVEGNTEQYQCHSNFRETEKKIRCRPGFRLSKRNLDFVPISGGPADLDALGANNDTGDRDLYLISILSIPGWG
jgi:hypothetical protein